MQPVVRWARFLAVTSVRERMNAGLRSSGRAAPAEHNVRSSARRSTARLSPSSLVSGLCAGPGPHRARRKRRQLGSEASGPAFRAPDAYERRSLLVRSCARRWRLQGPSHVREVWERRMSRRGAPNTSSMQLPPLGPTVSRERWHAGMRPACGRLSCRSARAPRCVPAPAPPFPAHKSHQSNYLRR